MIKANLWIIESRQINPNDMYVKTDNSQTYTAYWVGRSESKDAVCNLVIEAAEELVLGNTEILSCQPYTKHTTIDDQNINPKIEQYIKKLVNNEDVQLAAWLSSDGGLW